MIELLEDDKFGPRKNQPVVGTVDKREMLRARYLGDFYVFLEEVLGYADMYEPLHRKICTFLTTWSPGRNTKVLLIPRRHLKSSIATIGHPIWEWCSNPDLRFLMVQGMEHLAIEYLDEIKTKLGNPLLPYLFPNSFYKNPRDSGKWQADRINIRRPNPNKVPSMFVTGENSSRTGTHYNRLIVDDLVHSGNYDTEDKRQKTKTFYANLLPQLLPGARVVIPGTRWHWGDLYGQLISTEDGKTSDVEVMKMDCGWRAEGEWTPTFPLQNGRAGFTKESLEALRTSKGMTPFTWSCQYMNDPTPTEMKYFNKEDFDIFDLTPEGKPPTDDDLYYFTAVDPNHSKKATGDPAVVMTVGRNWRGEHWVVEMSRGHPSGPVLIDWIRHHVIKWHPERVIFEAYGHQETIGDWCMKDMQETGIYYNVMPAPKKTDTKIERVTKMQPLSVGHGIKIRRGIDQILIDELQFYPNWHNDDAADCLGFVYACGYNPPMPEKYKARRIKDPYLAELEMRWRADQGVYREYSGGVYRG